MLLEPLTNVLALVRDRITKFGHEFTNNELQTRLSLVDPVLRVLGWDPQDPTTVRVEHSVRQRNRNNNIRVDYALLGAKHEPVAFVEAKKLGTDLGPAHHQLFEYSVGQSVPYAIATNGADWAVYKQEQTGTDFLSKRLLAVSIPNQSPTLAAIKLLSLWKGLLTSQSSIDLIAPAMNQLETNPLEDETTRFQNRRHTTDTGQEKPTVAPRIFKPTPQNTNSRKSSEVFSLSNPVDVTGRKPVNLRLPDGTGVDIATWASMLEQIVRWLSHSNVLNVAIPWTQSRSSKRIILQNTEFFDRNGFKVGQQVRIKPDLHLLTNISAQNCCNIANNLLTDCGVDSSAVKVTLATRNH